MSENIDESELIFKIYRVKSTNGDWMPAISDIKSHDISPLWAAGLAFVLMDRYVNCIDESNQLKFQQEMLYWLDLMLKDDAGVSYVFKTNKPEDMD